MEVLFENSAEELAADPSLLNEVTDRLLKEAAKEHHPHNRLLPATFVQLLLTHIAPELLTASNADAQKHLLASCCLRNILIPNFPQLADNKLFRAVVFNYAQTLNELTRREREGLVNAEGSSLKYAARGYILNEIMLKLAQISHVFVPELLRFAKIMIEIGLAYLQQCSEPVEQKQLRVFSKLAEKSKIPTHLYKLTSRKVWKKASLVVFLKNLFDQVKTFLTSCGYTKHALGLQIYKEILEQF
jgi:hypothetical protein